MRAVMFLLGLSIALVANSPASAGISLAPYASIKSTKTKRRSKDDPSK